MKKIVKIIVILLVIAFIGIQLIPLDRSNPPVVADIPTPPEVRAILKKSCYDCHSNETKWPWYAYVAPASWLVVSDVHEAREHVNFSDWNQYGPGMRIEHIKEMWEEIEEGGMPLWQYTLIHRDALLSDTEKATIRNWVASTTGSGPTSDDDQGRSGEDAERIRRDDKEKGG